MEYSPILVKLFNRKKSWNAIMLYPQKFKTFANPHLLGHSPQTIWMKVHSVKTNDTSVCKWYNQWNQIE